ncbi:hypothetical protein U1Q18_031910 [Sarracenia purpurea var. burkii]
MFGGEDDAAGGVGYMERGLTVFDHNYLSELSAPEIALMYSRHAGKVCLSRESSPQGSQGESIAVMVNLVPLDHIRGNGGVYLRRWNDGEHLVVGDCGPEFDEDHLCWQSEEAGPLIQASASASMVGFWKKMKWSHAPHLRMDQPYGQQLFAAHCKRDQVVNPFKLDNWTPVKGFVVWTSPFMVNHASAYWFLGFMSYLLTIEDYLCDLCRR